MPQICQRLGIPGYALNRKLFDATTGLAWLANELTELAEYIPQIYRERPDTLDTALNQRLMETFGGVPPILARYDMPVGATSIDLYAPGALPVSVVLHTLTEAFDKEAAKEVAKANRDRLYEHNSCAEITVYSADTNLGTPVATQIKRIANFILTDEDLPLIMDVVSEDDREKLLAVAEQVRTWHQSALHASRGEIMLDPVALRIGRMVRQTKQRWPGTCPVEQLRIDSNGIENPLIDAALLDASYGPLSEENKAELHLDATQAIELIVKRSYIELVDDPSHAVGNINRVPSLCLSEKNGAPLVNLLEPFSYQTNSIIVVAQTLPESTQASLRDLPLEQVYTSPFTDNLGIVLKSAGNASFCWPNDWHRHYTGHVVANNQLVAFELPVVILEDHIATGADSLDHINNQPPIAPAMSLHIQNPPAIAFRFSPHQALSLLWSNSPNDQ